MPRVRDRLSALEVEAWVSAQPSPLASILDGDTRPRKEHCLSKRAKSWESWQQEAPQGQEWPGYLIGQWKKTPAGMEHLRSWGKGSWVAEEDPLTVPSAGRGRCTQLSSLAALGAAVSRSVENCAFSDSGCGTLISGLAVCASPWQCFVFS